ncbi:DJ-1/PfpI family protein [Prescottella defluvii]|nr:DJ-1/PfpI family protein [Prescottella defluvii]
MIVASSDRLLDPAAAQQLIGNLQAHLAVGTAVRPGLRVASICSGAFLLGAMGLLDDRDATTHWRRCDTLARRHLGARIHPEALYVDAGEVLTSAGVAAGIDLCLHIIRSDHGTRIANNVARSCIVAPLREGGQAQYIQATVTRPAAARLPV